MPRSLAARTGMACLAVLALALGALFAAANDLRHFIERAVSEATGRSLTLGELRLALDPHLVVTLRDLRYANPDWASAKAMLDVKGVRASIAWLPLLAGRVVLLDVTLDHPLIDLERRANGSGNWSLGNEPAAGPDSGARLPEVRTLSVDDGRLTVADAPTGTYVTLTVRSSGARAALEATGQYAGLPLSVHGEGDSLLSLADSTRPYAAHGEVAIGNTRARFDGTVTGLTALAAADLQMSAGGESLDQLFPLIGVAIPPSPPWSVKGRLVRNGEWWSLHDFTGRIGDSDLSGSADLAYRNRRATVVAQLASMLLDLDDIGGFIGAKPGAATVSPRQRAEKAQAAAEPTLLPDVPIRLGRLRAMDADVTFKGRSIRGKTPVDNLDAHIVVNDGVMTMNPLDFGVGGGTVAARVVLDGRGETAAVESDIEFRRIRLSRLFPGNRTIEKATGLLGGHATLSASGDSFADLLAHSNGRLGLAMAGGTVSDLVLKLAGLDVAQTLRLLFTGDKPVTLRCAVTDLDVKDGVVNSRSTILDTTDTNLSIDGHISFAGEELDLTLHPLPKDYSLVSLRSPLHLHGTFKHPAVRLDPQAAARGGLAAILGAVASPAAALVPLVETGPGTDADCGHLIAAVERHLGETVPEARPAGRRGSRN